MLNKDNFKLSLIEGGTYEPVLFWRRVQGFVLPRRDSENSGAPVVRRRSFTLVELVLVVIIIGVLAAMVVPRLAGRSEQARLEVAKTDVNANLATALKLFEIDNGAFPTTDEGLKALIDPPSSAGSWKGPYLEKGPLDPWGREYLYRCPGVKRPYGYDLFSLGKDGVESEDDITNWEN